MASYFKLRTGLARGIDNPTGNKKVCTEKVEYFCQDATGVYSVNVYEDGFVYMSPVPSKQLLAKYPNAVLQVPAEAVPCSAAEYEAAHALFVVAEAKRKAEEEALKALRKGMSRNQHAAEEAQVAEPIIADIARMAPMPHFLDDFTVIDLEFQINDLLELAAIRYQNWQPVGQVQSLVRFRGSILPQVHRITGIREADVWNAPEEKAVLQRFKQLAGDSLLVCHNLSADRRILEAARTRCGAQQALPNEWFCTLALARQRLPDAKSHKLGDLCTRFGIAAHGAHRALRDVEMCAGLLQRLHQMEPVNGPLLAKAKGKKAAAHPSLPFAA
ncbi:3'-5' exonuclease [Hymenobacter cellulosivorans]|uniref:3'-5' exonuclease n=1 Tax=Hymenobacter cellulosivorans TaxID=2932249 RepID=A0ABY4FF55_9BACT|nr:3'-5' exonuclease [Hymenobacter cellulosivorans]UOQ53081.1 3'-5' exonuclease [Hymenobacter cellulosivorans]